MPQWRKHNNRTQLGPRPSIATSRHVTLQSFAQVRDMEAEHCSRHVLYPQSLVGVVSFEPSVPSTGPMIVQWSEDGNK